MVVMADTSVGCGQSHGIRPIRKQRAPARETCARANRSPPRQPGRHRGRPPKVAPEENLFESAGDGPAAAGWGAAPAGSAGHVARPRAPGPFGKTGAAPWQGPKGTFAMLMLRPDPSARMSMGSGTVQRMSAPDSCPYFHRCRRMRQGGALAFRPVPSAGDSPMQSDPTANSAAPAAASAPDPSQDGRSGRRCSSRARPA